VAHRSRHNPSQSSIRLSFYSVVVSHLPGMTGPFVSDKRLADISFPGLIDIRLSADEIFLSRKADRIVLEVVAYMWFNTSIHLVG